MCFGFMGGSHSKNVSLFAVKYGDLGVEQLRRIRIHSIKKIETAEMGIPRKIFYCITPRKCAGRGPYIDNDEIQKVPRFIYEILDYILSSGCKVKYILDFPPSPTKLQDEYDQVIQNSGKNMEKFKFISLLFIVLKYTREQLEGIVSKRITVLLVNAMRQKRFYKISHYVPGALEDSRRLLLDKFLMVFKKINANRKFTRTSMHSCLYNSVQDVFGGEKSYICENIYPLMNIFTEISCLEVAIVPDGLFLEGRM